MQALRVLRWVIAGVLIVASFAAEAAGHAGLSWGIDGVLVVTLLVLWVVRARRATKRVAFWQGVEVTGSGAERPPGGGGRGIIRRGGSRPSR